MHRAGLDLHELTDAELTELSPHLTPTVRSVLSVRGALSSRSTAGGTAPERVREQLAACRVDVAQHRAWAADGP